MSNIWRSPLTCHLNHLRQWEIYDAYVEELQKQERNKEKLKAAPAKKEEDKGKKKMMLVEAQVSSRWNSTDMDCIYIALLELSGTQSAFQMSLLTFISER